ncbi:MAG: DUF2867 domain-containing protein [Chloroflexi bacterium]|nr:DUF2867 domain-containing protein [Chloroflexota bacterium]
MGLVLVLGASGYVGSHLVPRLVDAGHNVRAASRRPENLEGREWAGVERVHVDPEQEGSLASALAGVDTAYYLAPSIANGAGSAARDREAARRFRDAAAAAGVRRIILLGALVPPEGSSRPGVGDVLRAGPIPVTELRAGIIVGAGSAAFEAIRDLVAHQPLMLMPRWTRAAAQPIAVDDVATYLAAVLTLPETAGRTYDLAGPETLTYSDLISQLAQVTGRRRWLLPVPVGAHRISARWLGLSTSVPSRIARPLVEQLGAGVIADDRAIRELLPIDLQTYRESVLAAVELERDGSLPARWAEGAVTFRGYTADLATYSKSETSEVVVDAPASEAWRAVSSIGGQRGYYYANALWRLRGFLDRLVGGVGMRRGRRHPELVRPGDAVDFWRVVRVDPGRRLTLAAEMRVPGSALLEFEVVPLAATTSKVTMTALFRPSGLWGLLYWYSMLPAHEFIFRHMPRNLGRFAERAWAEQGQGR